MPPPGPPTTPPNKPRRTGKKISVLYIDLEAQYQATIDHVDELIRCTADVVDAWYWVAMPLSLRNAASAIRPKWICWDKKQKEKWVRPLPDREDVIMITEDSYPKEWTWFRRGMEFEEFILFFAQWFCTARKGTAAAGIGIRSDESLNRFRTIISSSKERFQDYHMCVGCGRCIDRCPEYISIAATVKKMANAIDEIVAEENK